MPAIDETPWRPITGLPAEEVPAAPGLFELATLVRSVLLIADDGGRGLRAAIAAALRAPGVAARAHCVRFLSVSDPRPVLEQRLAAYRQRHGGRLPPAQPDREQQPGEPARRLPRRRPTRGSAGALREPRVA